MKATIKDEGMVTIIEQQLRAANLSFLEVQPWLDKHVNGYDFAVYSASLCNSDGIVFDAWVVSVDIGADFPFGGIYNKDNFTEPEDGIAHHVGLMVLDGRLTLVSSSDDNHSKTIQAN